MELVLQRADTPVVLQKETAPNVTVMPVLERKITFLLNTTVIKTDTTRLITTRFRNSSWYFKIFAIMYSTQYHPMCVIDLVTLHLGVNPTTISTNCFATWQKKAFIHSTETKTNLQLLIKEGPILWQGEYILEHNCELNSQSQQWGCSLD